MTAADGAASDFPAALFERQDNSADSLFYEQPRFVTHIDDATIAALTEFYREFIPQNVDVLDLMSSWISHLPAEVSYNSVTGHGMNAEELSANPRLTRHFVQDLNADPQLPVESQSIDCALIVVSIQYLIQPVQVMRELYRTLRARRPTVHRHVAPLFSHQSDPRVYAAQPAGAHATGDDLSGSKRVYRDRVR